jgi:exopolysaccharide biosynthesis polyprenyl glycosylphosphotransferase
MRTISYQITSLFPAVVDVRRVEHYLLLTLLVITDAMMVSLALGLAFILRFKMELSWVYHPEVLPFDFYQKFSFLLVPFWFLLFSLFGLYDWKRIFAGIEEYILTFHACTLGMMLVILYIFFAEENIARGWVALAWLLLTFNLMLGRFAFRRLVHYLRERGHLLKTVLIVGANEESRAIADQLSTNRKAGVWIAGVVDDELEPGSELLPEVPVLGSIDFIETMVEHLQVHEIIIAATAIPREKLFNLFRTFSTNDEITIRLSSGLYELLTTGVEVTDMGNVPLLSINKMRLTGSEVIIKRVLDVFISIVALLLLWPVMLIMAVAIKLDSSGPVFYKREVVGAGGKIFHAWKFRTMYSDADERLARDPELRRKFESNFKLKDDPRVTQVGKFLRRTSLDELPQLFNVLAGQMSLVGPRMITKAEQDRYGKWQMNLFTVKPGITGLWQVSGRSDVSYEERVTLDMHYIRNYSIWSDLYLLWLTVPAVLRSKGAY